MLSRKQELTEKFINNEITAEDLIDMVIELEGRIDGAIGFTDYEWDSQWRQLNVIKETLEGK